VSVREAFTVEARLGYQKTAASAKGRPELLGLAVLPQLQQLADKRIE
jgi:hypothetical protein